MVKKKRILSPIKAGTALFIPKAKDSRTNQTIGGDSVTNNTVRPQYD